MGPKKAPPSPSKAEAAAAAPVADEPPVEVHSDFAYAIKVTVPKSFEVPNELHLRVFSEWFRSGPTPHFSLHSERWKTLNGGGQATPEPPSEEDAVEESAQDETHVAVLKESLHPKLGNADEITAFNAFPGFYAVLMSTEKGKHVPLGFAYLDCSRFLVETGSTTVTGRCSLRDFSFEVSFLAKKTLISSDVLSGYEPMTLEIKNIGNLPLLESEVGEGELSTLKSSFAYGRMNLGGNIERMIFAAPHVTPSTAVHSRPITRGYVNDFSDSTGDRGMNTTTMSTTSGQAAALSVIPEVSLSHKTCILQGAMGCPEGNKLCRESLTSTTFVLELHTETDEMMLNRMFPPRIIEDLKNASKAKKDTHGKKKTGGVHHKRLNITEEDALLCQTIDAALHNTGKVYYHGTIRFRLEQLLSSSNDLLKEFARKRLQLQQEEVMRGTLSQADQHLLAATDDTVVIHEDMLLEIKLCNPSKPLKWKRPDDISLLSALDKAKEEFDALTSTADLNGTGGSDASATVKAIAKSSKRKVVRPRHERFTDCETHIAMYAELMRKLEHPTETPKVFADPNSSNTAVILPGPTLGGTPSKPKAMRVSSLSSVQAGDTDSGAVSAEESPTVDASDSAPPSRPSSRQRSRTPVIPVPPTMAELVSKRLAITPFTRMIITFRYKDDATLKMINDAIVKVNTKALPNMQSSIRSYTFSEREVNEVATGKLDCVCGFSIIDDDIRIVVLEGLAGPGQGMQSVYLDIPRMKPNDDKGMKILVNPEVLFPTRLYPEFGPDIKRIRIRDKLKKLSRKPEIYNRKQVDEICFQSVECIMSLRRAVNLQSTKELDLYPTAASLSKLELLYGEAISRADLDGIAVSEQFALMKKKAAAKQAALEKSGSVNFNGSFDLDNMSLEEGGTMADGSGVLGGPSEMGTATTPRTPRVHKRDLNNPRLLPTTCTNPEFEDYLKTKHLNTKDYLAEQRELKKAAWEAALGRMAERESQYTKTLTKVLGPEAVQGGGKIYAYSQQALNFRVKQQAEMRKRLAKVKDATFTYSQDFISQTVAMTDEKEDKAALEASIKQEWTTPGGFLYPKPRTQEEILLHPKRPTDSRIEELKQPYPAKRAEYVALTAKNPDPELLAREQGFVTQIQGNKAGLFGALQEPKFERPFTLNLIGDKHKLPRGKLVAGTEQDPAFFKSVHIAGDELTKLIEAKKVEEKEEWEKKVVVDHLDFKIDGYNMRDKPHTQLSRLSDILHDEPKRVVLKHIRSLKSPTVGKDWSYSTTPFTIMNTGAYENPQGNAMQRVEDRTKFVTATKEMLQSNIPPTDFQRYIGPNQTVGPRTVFDEIAKRKHSPVYTKAIKAGDASEPRPDPYWKYPSSTGKSAGAAPAVAEAKSGNNIY